MPSKHNKCCCCPECTVKGLCCKCIPKSLCFTLAGEYDGNSVELDYGSGLNGWAGALSADGSRVSFYLYYENDEYNDTCQLKLRSYELGYPEGSEAVIDEPYGSCVTNLSSSVGALSWEPVPLQKPTNCVGCKCLCDCICIDVLWPADYTRDFGTRCVGKLCWVYDENAWVGDVHCNDPYAPDTVYIARVEWRPRGELCGVLSQLFPYIECDPYDLTCTPVLQIPEIGIVDAIGQVVPCDDNTFEHTWVVQNSDGHTITVIARCAGCGESCRRIACCDWDDEFPDVIWLTDLGNECDPVEGSFPLTYAGIQTGLIHWWESELIPVRVFTGRPFGDGCGPPNVDNTATWGDEWNFVRVRIGCIDAINPDGQGGSSGWLAQLGCAFGPDETAWGLLVPIDVEDCDPFLAFITAITIFGGGDCSNYPGPFPPPGGPPPENVDTIWMLTW